MGLTFAPKRLFAGRYAADATFSISLWFSKENCTQGVREYLYSHHSNASSAAMSTTAHVDIYVTCAEGSGDDKHRRLALRPGRNASIVRYELCDDDGRRSSMDFPLRAAAGFDNTTSTWVHVLLAVSPTSLVTYEDGVRVPDKQYQFEWERASNVTNNAYPRPSHLNARMRGLSLVTPLHIGVRADAHRGSNFRGTSHPLCIFHLSAGILGTCHHLDISLAQIEWRPALVWRRSAKSAATRTELLLNFIFRLQVRSGARRVPRRALHQEHPVLRKIRWVRAAAGRLCEARPLLRSAAALLEADP